MKTTLQTFLHLRPLTIGLMLAALSCAAQNPVLFHVTLSGANDVPPSNTADTGEGTLTLQENTVSYQIAVTPCCATTGEIHGPAGPGTNAPVIFDLGQPGCAPPHPPLTMGGCLFRGSVTVSDEQRAELEAGLWYVLIYSGERIRGQIVRADLDSDADGVPDINDQCPNTPAGRVVNEHGCSIAQLCPCAGPWRNHAQYLRCVWETASDFAEAGLITEKQRRHLFFEAAKSNCGRHRR